MPRPSHITFVETGHKIISTPIGSSKGVVSYWRTECALTLVNRLGRSKSAQEKGE